ncbi:MAG: tRNA (adenosine(37)-N6)-threonylcarbamoyltransferase complex dimerization subunit type 1 TsaB [Dehalococcoidia bacterium]|nr:tRNA (adenosine(37)-N6)-threonylcarbamoyltransferase complex dimerization subunit type 1 TsaB [Dehalococcoidia bacterium]
MSTTLAIDTASPVFALALAVDGVITASLQHEGEQEHSQQLLAQIDTLLGARKQDLDGIVVVHGPGSYAGLRVGIATAEGLAISRNVPVVGVGTLEAVALAAGADGVAIHPAGRGEFAAQPFANGVTGGEAFIARLADLGGQRLAGEGAAELGGKEVTPEERVRTALELGLPRLADATGSVDAVYLREPNISRPRPRPAGGA